VPFADARWQASLTGVATVSATVRELLLRETTLDDYDIAGRLTLQPSTVRDLALDRARLDATLRQSVLTLTDLDAAGPAIEGRGHGTIALDDDQTTSFEYDVTRADLAELKSLTGSDAAGTVASKGRVDGPWRALHAVGDGSIAQLDAFNVKALTLDGHYDVTVPSNAPDQVAGKIDGHASFVTVLGQSVNETSGTVTMDRGQLAVDLRVEHSEGVTGTIAGSMRLRLNDRALDLAALTIGLGRAPWRLTPRRTSPPPDPRRIARGSNRRRRDRPTPPAAPLPPPETYPQRTRSPSVPTTSGGWPASPPWSSCRCR